MGREGEEGEREGGLEKREREREREGERERERKREGGREGESGGMKWEREQGFGKGGRSRKGGNTEEEELE